MRINVLTEKTRAAFCALFKEYYDELDCGEDTDHLLDEYVLADFDAQLLKIAVAEEDEVCGFVIYQTDSIENEWCLREGMGTVRELYVRPRFRGKGCGGALLAYAEDRFKDGGVKRVYVLPADGTQGFFISAGYAESDEYCEDTDCNFFYKEL